MRAIAVVLSIIFVADSAAVAQDEIGRTQRDGRISTAPIPTAAPCIDVEIDGRHSYTCLNERLKQDTQRRSPSLNGPPVDARSADIRVGTANTAAVRQQFGRNFGVSLVPERPHAVYAPPLARP